MLRCPVRHQVRRLRRGLQGRDEEDGVQDEAVAREVLCLLHLQEPDRNQVLHSQGERHLLRQVL